MPMRLELRAGVSPSRLGPGPGAEGRDKDPSRKLRLLRDEAEAVDRGSCGPKAGPGARRWPESLEA